jgi:colanic acid/amylovoran biosynthesis glycosyltransferase
MPHAHPSVCVVVNKHGGTLRPSESFLHAHITRLRGVAGTVLGMPGSRREYGERSPFLQSRALFARALRASLRAARITTASHADTGALVRYLRRRRVDVVLAEYGPTALSLLDACRETGIPLVAHFHGWDAYVLASVESDRANYLRLFEEASAVVAVSRHMRDHLVGLGAHSTRVVWNPCGADPGSAIVADPSRAGPAFVSIGRPAPKKATIVSLLAFAQVLTRVPDASLELIGGGIDDALSQSVRALGLGPAVRFPGAMSHGDVLKRLSLAGCYLHPSVTAPNGDMEGTPVSLLEAMAAGLPVVATRHGGIRDVLEGSAAGILVDEYDVAGTAQAMLTYAVDGARAGRDGAEGRRLVIERWSMARSLERLDRLLALAARRDIQGIAGMSGE